MSKKKKLPPVVTIRTIVIDWEGRSVTINGRRIETTDARFLHIPILSGDAVFMSRDAERIA